MDKGATGKPTCGDIRDRMSTSINILDWVDPKSSKQVLPFQNVLEKRGIDLDTAKAELVKFFGVEMPDEQLVKREMKRGRKAGKTTVVKKEGGLLSAMRDEISNSGSGDVSDTDGISVDDVETVHGDMLTALAKGKPITEAKPKAAKRVTKKKITLMEAAEDLSKEEVVATPEPEPVEAPAPLAIKAPEIVGGDDSDDEFEEDDEGVDVELFKHKDTEYYKDLNNNLYDTETKELIGIWNEDTQEIIDM